MNYLFYFTIFIHIVLCLFLIGVVLLQQGKSADLGVFGGQGTQAAFGPRGTANLLTKFTTWSAVAFMVTSMALTILAVRLNHGGSVLSGTPTTQEPAKK